MSFSLFHGFSAAVLAVHYIPAAYAMNGPGADGYGVSKNDYDNGAVNVVQAREKSFDKGGEGQISEEAEPSYGVDEEGQDILYVTSTIAVHFDFFSATLSLDDTAIREMSAAQLGEVLTAIPGLSASAHAPGASRPIVRGLQGARVKVLNDDLSPLDASVNSVDHGVVIDTISAAQIDIVRGPAALLYGGGVVGGAINVTSRHIPRELPDGGYEGALLASGSTVADEYRLAGWTDVTLGRDVVLHLDVTHLDREDQDVGGRILSAPLIAEARAAAAREIEEGELDAAAEFEELAEARGGLENSSVRTTNGSIGLSYIGDGGQIGLSYSYLHSNYGVPLRPVFAEEEGEGEEEGEEGHGHEDVSVRIAMRQHRADLRSTVFLDGFFERANMRFGFADYEHVEREDGVDATRFSVSGVESRFTLTQAERGGWTAEYGVNYLHRRLNAVGPEAYLPLNMNDEFALFTVQQWESGPWHIDAAFRYDHVHRRAPDRGFGRGFNVVSFAAGITHEAIDSGFKQGANFARIGRAPTADELLSDGLHIATSSTEIGDPALNTERGWSGEIYSEYTDDDISVRAAFYRNWFSNFIFAQVQSLPDGGGVLMEEGFPVRQYIALPARLWGVEGSLDWRFWRRGDSALNLSFITDFTRGKLRNGGGGIPQIPPFRLRAALEYSDNHWKIGGNFQWTAKQTRVAQFETPTPHYIDVGAALHWYPAGAEGAYSVSFIASNLFDTDQRRHASFTKDFVPLPGRDVRLQLRWAF